MSSKFTRIAMITVVVVIIDQATKWWAWATLKGEPRQVYLDGMLTLSFHENPGAFLSLGAGLPEFWRVMIFVGLTSLFLVYLLYFLLTDEGINARGLFFGGMMFAGGLGNLIDRIFYENGVIDFLNVGIGNLRTGIFNVADMAIMVGVIGLLLLGRQLESEPAHPSTPEVEKEVEVEKEEKDDESERIEAADQWD